MCNVMLVKCERVHCVHKYVCNTLLGKKWTHYLMALSIYVVMESSADVPQHMVTLVFLTFNGS